MLAPFQPEIQVDGAGEKTGGETGNLIVRIAGEIDCPPLMLNAHMDAVEPGREIGDSDGTFVAVPWTVGCGCADEGWDQPDWVSPGDTVAFILSVTRKRVPWSGPPVFDVLGWHQPYPSGDFIPYWKPGREGPETWLSSADFFDLLQALPDETSFRLDPSTALRAIRSWVDRNPDAAEVFPVPTLTAKLEEMSEGWEPEGLSPL